MGVGTTVQANLRFAEGSVATISYVTEGSSRFPKETLDLAGDGRNGRLDNFQLAQLERFVESVRAESPMPIPLESLVATTRATLAVGSSLSSGRPVSW
jgi:hypothetical protein